MKGMLPFKLAPKPGNITLTLQVTNTVGKQVIRTVNLETYDPNAVDPAVTAAKTVGEAIANLQKATEAANKKATSNSAITNPLGSDNSENGKPTPILSPTAPPPQYN